MDKAVSSSEQVKTDSSGKVVAKEANASHKKGHKRAVSPASRACPRFNSKRA